jgi:hypothetical protein
MTKTIMAGSSLDQATVEFNDLSEGNDLCFRLDGTGSPAAWMVGLPLVAAVTLGAASTVPT